MSDDVDGLKMPTLVDRATARSRAHASNRRQTYVTMRTMQLMNGALRPQRHTNNLMTGDPIASYSKEVQPGEKESVIPVIRILVSYRILPTLPLTKAKER